MKNYTNVKGEIIITNKYVYHVTDKVNLMSILKNGLKIKLGFHYKNYARANYDITNIPKALFAVNTNLEDVIKDYATNLLGGKIIEINTKLINNIWYKDRHFTYNENYIVTFENIPKEAISFIYDTLPNLSYKHAKQINKLRTNGNKSS